MADRAKAEVSPAAWRQSLSETRPRVARSLIIAAERRQHAANTWGPTGARLTGLEELLLHLDAVADASSAEGRPGQIVANLVTRMSRDFETALEAGLSGYAAVAMDAMRDVMEATDLVLMFSTDSTSIESWADTDPSEHWKRFSPGAIRKHLLKHGIKYKDDARATIDYQGHSMALHVKPWRLPIAERGLTRNELFSNDIHFWEIFGHARELVFALDRLRDTTWPEWKQIGRAEDLAELAKAYDKSMEMQTLFLSILQASIEARRNNQSADGVEKGP